MLSFQAMFEKRKTVHQYETSLSISYMEIYKDEVYDLLVTRENVRLQPLISSCSQADVLV